MNMARRKKEKLKPSDKLARTNKELVAEKKLIKVKSKGKVKISKVKSRKKDKKIKRLVSAKKAIDNSQIEAKLDKEKQLIIFSGVTFFMVLIAFFWIINVSQVFEKMRIASDDDNDLAGTWQELSEGLGQRLDQMKVNLDKIDELKDNLIAEEYNFSATEKLPGNDLGTSTEDEITEEQVEKLKEILENN